MSLFYEFFIMNLKHHTHKAYLNICPTELANRKILEEIQLKKQQILKQGVAPSLNSPTIPPSLSAVGPAVNLVGVKQVSVSAMRYH
jgi:hypothetical protein